MLLAAQPYAPNRLPPVLLPSRRVDRRLQFLQTLSQVQPSAATWHKVLEGFEAWSSHDAGFSFWVSLAADQLARWDDQARLLPLRWLWPALRGEACPPWVLKLVRAVELPPLRGTPAADTPWPCVLAASSLAASPQIRWLGLHDPAALQPDALCALLAPARWPGLTALSLRGAAMSAAAWDAFTAWACAHDRPLSLSACAVQLDDAALSRLLDAAAFAQVTQLDLRDNRLSDRAAAALAASLHALHPSTARLTSLDLRGNPIGRAGLDALQRALASRPELSVRLGAGCLDAKGLRRWLSLSCRAPATLDLSRQQLPADAIDALIARAAPHHIKHLDLSATGARALTLRAWLRAPWVAAGVEHLALRSNGLSAGTLWPSATLTALRALDVSCNPLRRGGAEALAQWSLPALRSLCVARTQLGDDGARALRRAPWWGQLQSLDLSRCDLTAAGVQALLAGGLPDKLQRLNLSGNPLGPDGLRAVAAACAGSTSLRALDLSGCGDDAEAQILPLTQPNALTTLTTTAALTPPLIARLAASPYLAHLCRLDADWRGLSPQDIQPLRDSPWVGEPLRALLSGVGAQVNANASVNQTSACDPTAAAPHTQASAAPSAAS